MTPEIGDTVTFTTPKGRELRGHVFLRGDWLVAVRTEQQRMMFILHQDDVKRVPAGNTP